MTHVVKAAFAAMLIMIVPTARAVDVKAGNWDLSFSGNVNAFATYNLCADAPDAVHAIRGVPLACAAASAPHQFSIESGLLPSAFVFTAKTTVAGLDTSATIGLYPGLHMWNTRSGKGTDFTADVRQNFLTVGNKAWGTVKLGKDIGLFGSDAILSDMLLLGVGAGAHNAANPNVTIGHIGTGYVYADWIPQITYYTPSFNGLQVTLSVVEAFGNGGFSTQIPGQSVPALNNNQPGFQGRVSYDMTGPVTARAWVGGMYQHAKAVADTHAGLDSIGLEAGAKASSNGISALAYGYWGNGIGTTLLGLAGTNGVLSDNGDLIRTRKSYGFFGQVTAEIPGTKLKPGISYGNSFLKEARFEDDPNLLRSNSMFTGALFYALTPNLTLTAEYDHLWSRNQANWVLQSNTVALGGIIFF